MSCLHQRPQNVNSCPVDKWGSRGLPLPTILLKRERGWGGEAETAQRAILGPSLRLRGASLVCRCSPGTTPCGALPLGWGDQRRAWRVSFVPSAWRVIPLHWEGTPSCFLTRLLFFHFFHTFASSYQPLLIRVRHVVRRYPPVTSFNLPGLSSATPRVP